ncbi:MAG TPA: hypothetical protein VJ867_11255 [Gemmatimonadaceae bacterium]|nr:hypothetical protein [Gemmatimonadaceae bacterium]
MSKDKDGFSHHYVRTTVTRKVVLNGKEVALNADGSIPADVLAQMAAQLDMTVPALQELLASPADQTLSTGAAAPDKPDERTVQCPKCHQPVLARHGWCMQCGHKMHD